MIKNVLYKLKNAGENDKIVYKNVVGAFLIKGCALFVTLFTLPSYIKFFNNDEVLGLWFTILSLLNWILNFDLGIGNGLRNHLSTSISQNNKDSTKRYISSAYISIGVIVVVLSGVFPIAVYDTDLNKLLSIDTVVVSEQALYITAVIVFVGVMLQFWLKLINSVLYALQKSSVNNFLVLCTNVMILVFARAYPSGANNENIIVMAIFHALAVAIPLLVATIYVFAGRLRYAIPKLKYFSKEHTKKVLSLGGVFFFIQIAYMIIMSTNEFLIAKTTDNASVVDYQAYYKLFSLGSTVFALALTPLWSVITKAKAEHNIGWIKSIYKKFILLGSLVCLGEIAIILVMKPVMNLWLGEAALPEMSFFIGIVFALLGCAMVMNGVFSSVANGIGNLKVQAVCFGLGALLKVPLAYAFVAMFDSWLGVVAANFVCMVIYCIAQPISFSRYFKSKM